MQRGRVHVPLIIQTEIDVSNTSQILHRGEHSIVGMRSHLVSLKLAGVKLLLIPDTATHGERPQNVADESENSLDKEAVVAEVRVTTSTPPTIAIVKCTTMKSKSNLNDN